MHIYTTTRMHQSPSAVLAAAIPARSGLRSSCMVSRALPVLLPALLSAFASSSPDGGLPEVEQGLAGVEPDLRVVARRGPSGFGVVVRLSASSWGEVNLVTGLRGPAAEDGLLRVGDLVLEVDGERIPPG